MYYTDEEINIWKQRAGLVPGNKLYNSSGDAGQNTPGDWENILRNANVFITNPLSEVWNGDLSISPYTRGIGMRDAAFTYLLTNDNKYLNAAKAMLLQQADVPNTKFANWQYVSDTKAFHEGDWISRLFYGYMYIRTAISDSERNKLDKWFLDAANYFANNIHEDIKKNFPNRLNGDYSTRGNVARSGAMQNNFAYIDANGNARNRLSWLSAWYNNRRFSQLRVVGLAGVMFNDANLIKHAKAFVTEWLKYSVFPDGSMGEYQRNGNYGNAQNGMIYGSINIQVSIEIADLLARAGDISLYQYETSEGLHGTEGGKKSIYLTIETYYKQIDKQVTMYYGSVNEANRIDQISSRGIHWINDIWFAKANIYYKDEFFKNVYTRKSGGVETYPSSGLGTAGPIRSPWGGSGGVFAGILFMYGQMEGLIWPYDDGKQGQSITFPQLDDRFLSDGSFELNANSSSGLPVQFEVVSGPALISDNIISFTDIGEVSIRASQPGNNEYRSTTITQSFQVKKKIVINGIVDQIVADGNTLEVDVTLDYGGNDPTSLSLTAASNEQTIIPDESIIVSGSGLNWKLSIQSLVGTEGSVNITLNSSDGGADADKLSFSVLVGKFSTSALRIDAGLETGEITYNNETFVPLLPYLVEGVGRNSLEVHPIANTDFDELYQKETWGNSIITKYAFPVAQGEYTIHLHFADWHYEKPGDRVMDILLENELVLDDFDIINEVGKSAVIIKSFDRVIMDGNLELEIRNINGFSQIAAIEILPQGSPSLSAEKPDALNQVINFQSFKVVTIEDSPINLNATSSSGLPVEVEVVSGPAEINGNQLLLNDFGIVTVKASQAGDERYLPANDVIRTFRVTEKIEIQDLSDQIITQNTTLGPINLALKYSGDINNIKISANAENKALIPDENIILQRDNDDFTLTITPAKDLTGLSKVTIEIFDNTDARIIESFNVLVEEGISTVSALRLDAGLSVLNEEEAVYEEKLFEPLVPYLKDGTAYSTFTYWVADISNTDNDGLYQTELWWESDSTLNFEFPIEPGEYTVHLHFVDLYGSREGEKLLDVALQNVTVLNNYDIIKEVGSESAVIKSFDIVLAKGNLGLSLFSEFGFNQISGIEILPRGEAPLKLTSSRNLVNNIPTIKDIEEPIIQEGATVEVVVSATDADNEPISLSIQDLPEFASFVDEGSGNGTIKISPDFGNAGTYNPILIAIDSSGGESRLAFEITVVELPIELKITSFTLINADTDEDIGMLSEGDTIRFATIGTKNINIRAEIDSELADKIDFAINDISLTAEAAPFELFNTDVDKFQSNLILNVNGMHTLEATPYKIFNSGDVERDYSGDVSKINFYIDSNLPEFKVEVSPNPSSEVFNLALNRWSDSGMYMTLLDATGKVYFNREIYSTQRDNVTLQLSDVVYASGLYYLRIYSLDGSFTNTSRIMKSSR
ncbi:MAG: malectin domain-containing carbohydrate-binding protein [Bacteroidota bacterium]